MSRSVYNIFHTSRKKYNFKEMCLKHAPRFDENTTDVIFVVTGCWAWAILPEIQSILFLQHPALEIACKEFRDLTKGNPDCRLIFRGIRVCPATLYGVLLNLIVMLMKPETKSLHGCWINVEIAQKAALVSGGLQLAFQGGCLCFSRTTSKLLSAWAPVLMRSTAYLSSHHDDTVKGKGYMRAGMWLQLNQWTGPHV